MEKTMKVYAIICYDCHKEFYQKSGTYYRIMICPYCKSDYKLNCPYSAKKAKLVNEMVILKRKIKEQAKDIKRFMDELIEQNKED